MTGELYYINGIVWYQYAVLPDLTLTLNSLDEDFSYTHWTPSNKKQPYGWNNHDW